MTRRRRPDGHLLRSDPQPPRGLEVRPSPRHGYGVFTSTQLKKYTIVEEAVALPIEKSAIDAMKDLDDTVDRIVFDWSDDRSYIALGFGSIYNHSNEPNLRVRLDEVHRILVFETLQDVSAGEELLLNYGQDYWEVRDQEPR